MAERIKFAFIAFFCVVLCKESIDIWMMNTGDFDRAITPFMNGIKQFSSDGTLLYSLRDNFKSVAHYEYKSSFSYILYVYAYLLSMFTHTFDLRIWSALSKIVYVFFLFKLFSEMNNKKYAYLLFPFSAILLFTPSIISQFTALYQEQIVITLLPAIIYFMIKKDKSNFDKTSLVICTALIATSKSQFFYLPILISIVSLVFLNIKGKRFHSALIVATLLSLSFSFFSPSATKNNSYHSLYFGTLLYNKINGKENPSWAVEDCVGVDAWGNKFDLDKGAVTTNKSGTCFARSEGRGLKDSLWMMVKNPSMIVLLPFDAGVRTQLTENYFHVFKQNKLIISKSDFLNRVEVIKDSFFSGVRVPVAFLLMVISLFLIKKRLSVAIFTLSAISISQFYISFIGEGYRDLDKHLFAMNFSFDLMVFIIICICLEKIMHLIKK